MPPPEPPSPVELERVALSREAKRELARLAGYEELPAGCTAEVGECLARHLEAEQAERERKNSATAGNVEIAIANACKAVEELVALDGGIDAESLRILRPHAKAFITAGRDRIAELLRLPRTYAHREVLRMTCPTLRRIFEKHVRPGFNTRGNLQRFVFKALRAAGIETPRIDEAHLERLDDFLDAQLPRP